MPKKPKTKAHHQVHRDPPDERDHIYSGDAIAPSVDLRRDLFDVENQRNSNGCGGFAASTLVEMLFKRFRPAKAVEFSPLFAWWNARAYAGDTLKNEGVTSRTLLKGLHKQGICPEVHWPFDESKYLTPPPQPAFRTAKRLRIKSYKRCNNPRAIKAALSEGLPVLLGLMVREGLERISGPLRTHPAQFAVYREQPERFGHFMVIVGYRRGGAILVNSWGTDVHDQGCLLIPWRVLMKDYFDIWVVTGIGSLLDGAVKSKRKRPA
ncbi:MAG TPA: C1 family peptidase [Verrucomicrobiota bacterium]|nr:C1 family peptidase [Verrucomicrobiota bacterium]